MGSEMCIRDRSVGALEFSDLAKTMEDFGHQNNWKSITQKYQELLDYTDLILEELDCCIKAVPAADETKESLSGYPEDIIKSLCIAVNEMDYQEVSDAIAKLDRYTYPGNCKISWTGSKPPMIILNTGI